MPHEMGRVYLVGAGPGAADLLTLRAARLIRSAEALLYDALVGPEILEFAPRGCVRIQTGKRGDRPSMRQDTINKLMLRLARRGLKVVRLKGGDPSIFGRVQEERDFLEIHRVQVEVVPGITALSAAAAQFAFPVTHRQLARRVTFATGRLAGGGVADHALSGMADSETTLALYMGANVAQEAARQLIAAGRSPGTPVMIAESVSLPEANAAFSSLAELADGAPFASNQGPILLVIGAAIECAAQRASQGNPLHADIGAPSRPPRQIGEH